MADQKNIGMAVIAYLGILIVVPLLSDAKNDPYVKFHVKQALVLLIANFIWVVPFIGWIAGLFVSVLWIMGIINAATGKMTPVPVLGKLADSFKF